jgi:branched-chain amino acid transport system substrate-binding protein
MFRQCFAVTLLGGLLLSGAACDKKSESAAAADIIVGEYGSMTGPQATFGDSTDDGVKLAVREINAKGGVNGRQIKLIADDDEDKQSEAVTVVTRLIQQDHAVAIIGEVASSLSIAGGTVCQQNGVPMISPSSTSPKVTAIGNMISRVCFIDPFQGYVGASFAKNTLKLDNAALLYNKSQAYSQGLANNFRDSFTKLGGKIVDEEFYHDGDIDYSAQLTSIRGANPQFIYIPGYYTEVVTIAQQARKLGITCPLIGGDGWVSDKLKDAGHALDGCYFSDHYAKEDTRPEVVEFLKRYNAQFHHDPDSMAALGYDAANLLFDAMKRSKSLKGDDLAAAINSTKDFKGVTGSITIDENRNAKKLAVIQKLDNGNFSYFATVQPPP